MKTYLKRPYEKPLGAVFYSSIDTLHQFPSRVNFRQRIVQPSTKEQQRLLSSLPSSSSPRLQHVHSGRYGIRPIWPSDESLCEQPQHGRKSSKRRSSSIGSKSLRSVRDQCFRSKSDLQKKSILPSISSVSYIAQEHGTILMLASISLLLLLFLYIIYRHRSTKLNEHKLHKQQQRRHSFEKNFLIPEPFEYRLPSIHPLPTIIEESPAILSPSNSSNRFTPVSSSTNSTSSPVVTDDNDSCNSSSTSLRQQEFSTNNIDNKENLIQTPSLVEENLIQTTSLAKENLIQTPPLAEENLIQKPSSVKEGQKPSSVKEQKPSSVKEEQKSSSVKEQKLSSVKEEQKPASVKEEQKPSSVKEQKSSPVKEEQKPASVKEEQKPSSVKEEQKSSSVKEQKPSSVKEGQKPSSVKEGQKSSSVKEEQKPSSVKEEQKPSSVKEEQKPSSVKEEQKPSSVKEEQKPASVKEEQKPSSVKQEQKPSPVKEEQKPASVKEEQKPSSVKEEQKPSSVKEGQKPSPVKEEQKPASVKEEQKPSSVEEEQKPSSVKEEQKPASSNRTRRSRFEQDSTESTVETPSTVTDSIPPVISRKSSIPHPNLIKDDYTSLEEIDTAVKEVGLVRSQLIFGIDYTISNLETGKESFHGLSLHNIQEGLLNPYQSVITIIGRTLERFDSDTLIPAFGFGDRSTLDRKIFPLRPDGSYCTGFRGVLEAYNEITPKVRMSGPTNFAPLIREAIRIVKKTGQYHILVIVADGQVTNERQTKDAIVEASNYPLSIVMVGVGDGPWDMMEEFDDSLPTRQFDNFQFVNYNSVIEASTNSDSTFALHALMEIPSQYAQIKKLGLLKDT